MKRQESITILYEDADICVCKKPIGIPCESKKVSQPDMIKLLKKQFFFQNKEKEQSYLALVHRLDQPVGGVMVFAKNKESAADLSSQIRNHTLIKQYLAIVTIRKDGIKTCGHLEDYLRKDSKTNLSYVVQKKTEDAKLAVLDYEIQKQKEKFALIKIHLTTGRHHQIRVQMAEHGMPLVYDRKYNPEYKNSNQGNLALYAYFLAFSHQIKKKSMEFIDYPLEEPFAEWLNATKNIRKC